jgi:cation diffusion facilitator family transporter
LEVSLSSEGSTKAVVAALTANIGIAVTKFVAAAVSGSASMLAEGIHSVADSINQVLLLVGGKNARRGASANHQFGFGRSRYLFAFLVAVLLFGVGGVVSLIEGLDKLAHPHELNLAWVPLSVLGVSILLESLSLRTAMREANKDRGSQSWAKYIRDAKAPELPVVVLEDIAALVGLVFAFAGVGLTVLTHDAHWDAFGTLAIALLLIAVAIFLGKETASLLVGEGASESDYLKIKAAILEVHEIQSVIYLKTQYLAPDDLLVAAKIAIDPQATGDQIAKIIDAAELQVRAAIPVAKNIYLEPDVLRDSKN